jgi:hypothetical protein
MYLWRMFWLGVEGGGMRCVWAASDARTLWRRAGVLGREAKGGE